MRILAAILHRASHVLGCRARRLVGLRKQISHVVTGADIAYEASFAPGALLMHPTGVVVAPGVVAGERCTIHQGVTLGGSPRGAPRLGAYVNLAPGARVLGPVTLGDRTRVGANAVVTRSFAGGGVVLVGIPAKVHRTVTPEELE